MKNWLPAFLLFVISDLGFANCDELAAVARSVENSVAEAASEKVKVEFSWNTSAYDNALVFADSTDRIQWHNRDECFDLVADDATAFMSDDKSWFVRINNSMDLTFRQLLTQGSFRLCHSRFDFEQGPWSGVTYDFVSVASGICQNVSFSFGTKEKWEE